MYTEAQLVFVLYLGNSGFDFVSIFGFRDSNFLGDTPYLKCNEARLLQFSKSQI